MILVFLMNVKDSSGFGLASAIWVTVLGKTGPSSSSFHEKVMENAGTLFLVLNFFLSLLPWLRSASTGKPLHLPCFTFLNPFCPLSPCYLKCSVWKSNLGFTWDLINADPWAHPDLLNQNPHGCKICRSFMSTGEFKRWSFAGTFPNNFAPQWLASLFFLNSHFAFICFI